MLIIFFKKTLLQNKLLFILFISFVSLQLFFTYKGVQTVPFFNYGMYSGVHQELDNTKVIYRISLGDSIISLSSLNRIPEDYIIGSISMYHKLAKANFNDPIRKVIERRLKNNLSKDLYEKAISNLSNDASIKASLSIWLIKVLNHSTGLNAETIKIYALYCKYNGAKPFVRKEELILEGGIAI